MTDMICTPASGLEADSMPLLPGVCRVWDERRQEGAGSAGLCLSPSLGEGGQPVVLCCAINGEWCPAAMEPGSVVSGCLAQGHVLRPKRDYSEVHRLVIQIPRQGDFTRAYFKSAASGAYVLLVRRTLCERARLRGSAGPWERLQLRPTASLNPGCFHLQSHWSRLPLCFDTDGDCFVQSLPRVNCQQAVFALQAADSAELLQEASGLLLHCAEQSRTVRELNEQFRAQRRIRRGRPSELSASFDRLTSGREAEEAQLVFMQDHLSFLREQLSDGRSRGPRREEGAERPPGGGAPPA